MTLLSALSHLHSAIAAASVTHHATSMAERVGAVEEARLALLAAHRAAVREATARERAAVLSLLADEATEARRSGVAGDPLGEVFDDVAARWRAKWSRVKP